MVILGTKSVTFINPDEREAWEAHAVDAYVVSRCPLHYCLIEIFNPKTQAYLKVGTYKLYPKHSKTPEMSEADRTLLAAGNMLHRLQQAVSMPTEKKLQHKEAIEKITKILNIKPERVADGAAPRVGGPTGSTTDLTAKEQIWAARPIHQ